MRSNEHPQLTIGKGRRVSASLKSNGVVNAVLITPPDLSLYLKLQNLLNYFIDCMNNLTSSPENHSECAAHLNRCIKFIEDLDFTAPAFFNDGLVNMLDEFIEDAHKFQELLNVFNDPAATRSSDQSAAVLLTAKASHLQWLSVCILEDLKKNHARH